MTHVDLIEKLLRYTTLSRCIYTLWMDPTYKIQVQPVRARKGQGSGMSP